MILCKIIINFVLLILISEKLREKKDDMTNFFSNNIYAIIIVKRPILQHKFSVSTSIKRKKLLDYYFYILFSRFSALISIFKNRKFILIKK